MMSGRSVPYDLLSPEARAFVASSLARFAWPYAATFAALPILARWLPNCRVKAYCETPFSGLRLTGVFDMRDVSRLSGVCCPNERHFEGILPSENGQGGLVEWFVEECGLPLRKAKARSRAVDSAMGAICRTIEQLSRAEWERMAAVETHALERYFPDGRVDAIPRYTPYA